MTTSLMSTRQMEPPHFNIEHQFKKYNRINHHGHQSSVHVIRWNPEGNIIASGGRDKQFNIHRLKDCELTTDPQSCAHGHTGDIDQISWSLENTNFVATGSLDRSVKIWDVRYVEPVSNIKLKSEAVALSWSGSGTTIAVGDKNDVISFYDTRASYKLLKDHKLQFQLCDLAWNKESDFFHIASGDGNIHVCSFSDLQPAMIIDAFGSSCGCIRFDPSGKYFAVGSNDAISTVWDSENLACIQAIDRLESPIRAVSFSHDSRYLASSSADDLILDVADTLTGEQAAALELSNPCLCLDLHPKDYILAYSMNDQDYREVGSIRIIGLPDRPDRRPKVYT